MPGLGASRVGARAASSCDGGELGELLATEETARTVTAASAAPAICFIRAPPRMGSRQPHGALPLRAFAAAVPAHTPLRQGSGTPRGLDQTPSTGWPSCDTCDDSMASTRS